MGRAGGKSLALFLAAGKGTILGHGACVGGCLWVFVMVGGALDYCCERQLAIGRRRVAAGCGPCASASLDVLCAPAGPPDDPSKTVAMPSVWYKSHPAFLGFFHHLPLVPRL